jgi:hypothetical protein
VESRRGAEGISRRVLLTRAGVAGLAAALAQVAPIAHRAGLLDEALALETDITLDTLSGVVAFILPGNDEYSKAQGEFTGEPGAIAADTARQLKQDVDEFVPASVVPGQNAQPLPASGAVAALFNAYALRVNPAAANGAFLSPFARLSFKEKAEVFRLLEAEPLFAGTEFAFVAGIAPGFVGFLAFSEAGVYDRATRKLSSRPVGWTLSRYGGPAEGHAELKGYYQGRRSALPVRGARRKPAKKRGRRRGK